MIDTAAAAAFPIIIGTRKLPRVAGIDGIRKKNTMMTPCIVNIRLYTSAVISVPSGVSSCRRTSSANSPPRKKKPVIENR